MKQVAIIPPSLNILLAGAATWKIAVCWASLGTAVLACFWPGRDGKVREAQAEGGTEPGALSGNISWEMKL